MKILAKTFLTRTDLENYIKYHYQGKKILKKDVISGTKAEMYSLGLDHTTSVHGVPCEITDLKKETLAPPDRGGVQEFGINIKRKAKK